MVCLGFCKKELQNISVWRHPLKMVAYTLFSFSKSLSLCVWGFMSHVYLCPYECTAQRSQKRELDPKSYRPCEWWKSSTCSLPLSQPSQSVVSHFSIILLTYTHPEYFKAKATFNSCNILFLFYVYVLFVYTLYSHKHVYTFVYYICIHKLHIALWIITSKKQDWVISH